MDLGCPLLLGSSDRRLRRRAATHTNVRDSMSNQCPQPTTHQPRTDSYPVFSSLQTMNSKRKGLRVSFAFFQRKYLPNGGMNETLATVEKLSHV